MKEIKSQSPEKYQEIWSRLYELSSNAVEHGENECGAVSNGYCNKNKFTFSVFDFGKGLAENVNLYNKNIGVSNGDWNTKKCIEWALDKANSTKQSTTIPRGAGFYTTLNFLEKYNGQMSIYTSDTYCFIKNGKKQFKKMKNNILGIIVSISIHI